MMSSRVSPAGRRSMAAMRSRGRRNWRWTLGTSSTEHLKWTSRFLRARWLRCFPLPASVSLGMQPPHGSPAQTAARSSDPSVATAADEPSRWRGRVLFAVKHLSSGGVITHMMTLAEGLQAAGWTVAVCSRGRVGTHPRGPDWFEARGIPHFTVGFPRTGKVADTLLHAPRALVQMAAAVRSFSPDLVHVHFRSVSPFARAIEATYGIPFVSTLHAGIRSDPLSRIGSFWGTRAIAVSSDTCESLQRAFGIPSHKVRLVYNGADA